MVEIIKNWIRLFPFLSSLAPLVDNTGEPDSSSSSNRRRYQTEVKKKKPKKATDSKKGAQTSLKSNKKSRS